MNEINHLGDVIDAVNNDTIHDAVLGAIADYCNRNGLDPDAYVASVFVYMAEE